MITKYLEKILVPFLRIVMRIFFRKIEVVNIESVPTDRPVIFTPNHPNSLIDGILAKAFLPRDPKPLAKSTLWTNPFTRALVVAANAIPVQRQQDASSSGAPLDNNKMFDACAQALSENKAITLFPEGTSHDEPELLPLKTGAARILLSAEKKGPINVCIVPIGLIFDNKKQFRSRVLIYIGKPITPIKHISEPDPENRDQVADVTDRIKKAIKSVTLNYPSLEEASIIQRAADLYLSVTNKGVAAESLVDEFSLHKQMADLYPDMKEAHPRKVSRVLSAVNSYDRLLRVLSVQHEHFIQDRPGIIHTVSSLQKVSLFLVRLPLAIAGIFLNALPHLLTRLIGNINRHDNRTSTIMIFAGFFIYPLMWTLEANILGNGLLPVWFWWLLAPVSGICSIAFLEQNPQLLEEMTTYLRLKTKSDIREEIEDRLITVEREVTDYIMTANSLATAAKKVSKPSAKKPKKEKPAAKKNSKKT